MSDLLMATYPAGTRLPVSYILKETVGHRVGLQGGRRHVQMAQKTKADSPGSPYWSGLDLARAPRPRSWPDPVVPRLVSAALPGGELESSEGSHVHGKGAAQAPMNRHRIQKGGVIMG